MIKTRSTTENRPAKGKNGIASSLSTTDEDMTPHAKSQRRLIVVTQQTRTPPNLKLISQAMGQTWNLTSGQSIIWCSPTLKLRSTMAELVHKSSLVAKREFKTCWFARRYVMWFPAQVKQIRGEAVSRGKGQSNKNQNNLKRGKMLHREKMPNAGKKKEL